MSPEDAARHVTIWNRLESRKIAGNAAPLRKNLAVYLSKHPECDVYRGQDQELKKSGGIDPRTGKKMVLMNEHIPIWHRREARKVTGNAAPLKKNLEKYLKKHPECEVYNHQDKFPERAAAARQRAEEADAAAAIANGHTGEGKKGVNKKGTFPRPGPIAGFANARKVAFSNNHSDHANGDHTNDQGSTELTATYATFNKPVVAIVSSPSDGTPYGMPLSPMGDGSHYNTLDYKGAYGMYQKPDAAYAEPSWQDMSRSWSNTPAWQIMASRSHIAGAPQPPQSPMGRVHHNVNMSDGSSAPITPSEPTQPSEFASPRSSLFRTPKTDFPMGSSLSSSPGSTPLSADVPMAGETGFLTPSVMDCSSMEHPSAMAFSPGQFLSSGASFSLGRR